MTSWSQLDDQQQRLVVSTPLKNMKVNGKDDIPYIMENQNVWNHQPVYNALQYLNRMKT